MEIVNVIKYEGDNKTFVWKHPKEDFNTSSQLIVHETQEAIFFLNGQPLDVFGSGKYSLETSNIPLLSKVVNIPTDGVSPFHCEVYFINKTQQMAIKWGTDSKVQFIEPKYGFPISIGASGEMALKVNDSIKLLTKIVGTEVLLTQEELVSYFKSFLMTKLKSYIAQTIRENSINIFEIDEKLVDFSEKVKELLIPDFADYGIGLEQFFITTIVKPEGDMQYEKFKELHFRQYSDIAEAKLQQQVGIINQQTEAEKKIIDSAAEAKKRQQEGYTYQQERSFDVASQVAQNEAIGEFTNMGVGLGMISSVGNSIGGVVSGALNETLGNNNFSTVNNNGIFCENCGTKIDGNSIYCSNCGTKVRNTIAKCKNCGFDVRGDAKFCSNCGTKRSVADE